MRWDPDASNHGVIPTLRDYDPSSYHLYIRQMSRLSRKPVGVTVHTLSSGVSATSLSHTSIFNVDRYCYLTVPPHCKNNLSHKLYWMKGLILPSCLHPEVVIPHTSRKKMRALLTTQLSNQYEHYSQQRARRIVQMQFGIFNQVSFIRSSCFAELCRPRRPPQFLTRFATLWGNQKFDQERT